MRARACLTAVAGILLSAFGASAGLLYYDGQASDGSYVNTAHAAKGLHYTYAGGKRTMLVSGGKRVLNGSGDPSGNDYFDLSPSAGSSWGLAGLYDAASGKIGGGSVEGVLYVSVLVRAHGNSDGTTERRTGDLPWGRYIGFSLFRDSTEPLGLGNEWDAYAYSIFGAVTGKRDLVDASGGTTYINVDRDAHLLVARIAFHADAADDLSVWLDPDPDNGDSQGSAVRRYIGTANGDFSFNRVAYRAGNIPTADGVDFDEVRFGTDWASVTPGTPVGYALWYDGQKASSTYVNTSYDAAGLTYTMANGQALPVTGGKRVAPGTGDAGTDTLLLAPAAGSVWDEVGLYDSASGLIGGGEVGGVLYFGALVRAYNAVSGATENKDGTPPDGTEAYVQITRTGLTNVGALGMGNGWNPWAYSIGGVFGIADLVQTNGSNYVGYNTSTRMLVAKITFKPGANDEATVWLEPNPDHGDAQEWTIRRAKVYGDFSFDKLSYRSGNLGDLSKWDFDEVRFSTDWRGIVTNLPPTYFGTLILAN